MSYDVIGDLHGHADTLRALLARLGYTEHAGAYRHPERKVLFVGDFIDRGPKIRETLQLVRAMVEAGTAQAVAGNHEFNAVRYHTAGEDGKPLRPHGGKNERQHRATLEQLAQPYPQEWAGWLAWFQNLPLHLEVEGLRVVHAAWCAESIRLLGGRGLGDGPLLAAASQPGTAEYDAVGALLCGPELALPGGLQQIDKDGHARGAMRVRWFSREKAERPATYRDLIFPPNDGAPLVEVPPEVLAGLPAYAPHEPPVIFGHYWMPPAPPRCVAANATCVDYSVALAAGGVLMAYRWDGEAVLSDKKFMAQARV